MEQKDAALTIVERSSKDGYNWRKYGQKLVKGIELPRSNYNRTHPNCQVKKKLECSHNGLFTATIYESVHDHHKPQPGHRQSVGASSINAQERDDEAEVLPASTGRASNQLKADGTPEPSSPSTSDDEGGEGTAAYRGTLEDEGDEVDPESKCRRIGSAPPDSTLTIRTAREPRVVVQTLSEVDILDDGYRWRKYAQKVVKGNPNPRSYYKCTNAGCPVRKHVERAYHDPKSVITAYEGKHNHDVPTARTTRHKISMPMAVQSGNSLNGGSLVPLIPVMLRPPNHIEDGMALLLPTAPNVISLDLDVGIGQIPERSCIQKQNLTEAENMTKHIHGANLTTSGLQSPIQSVGTLPFCGNGTMEQPAYRYRVIGQGQLNGSFATK